MVVNVIVPRPSTPTVYLPVIAGKSWFDCYVVKSASPVLMLPAPSAVNVPAAATNPAALLPLKLKAYEPFSSVRFCRPLITSVNVCVMDAGVASESVTVTPKVKVPAAVGMPVRSPFTSVKPGGKVEPAASENVYGAVPPVAANCTPG